MKKGYILVELAVYALIFSVLAMLTFQLASIFITKTTLLKRSSNQLQAIWFAQDLLTKDLKSISIIEQAPGGFIGHSKVFKAQWKLSGETLYRKSGDIPKSSIVAMGIESFSVTPEDRGFVCNIKTGEKSLNFFVARRL